MQTLWLSPTNFVTGDPSLQISYPFVSHPGTLVTSTTIGDFKWISMALPLPPKVKIEEVIICYQVTNPQSFISQTRLTEMTTPNVALVRHDDATDLTSTSPVCYTSKVLNPFVPTAAVELSLRLNFQDTSQEIMLGAVGVTIQAVSSSWVDATQSPYFAVPSFSTTGSIGADSLLLTVAALGPIVVGAYVGVQGTESGGAAAMRGRVTAINGLVLTLDTPATFAVLGAVVSTDAAPSLQAAGVAAHAAGGQIVFLPPGGFTSGVPNYARNLPIFQDSNVLWKGSGIGVTTIKLCDHAYQISPANPSLPNCGIFANRNSTWWMITPGAPDTNIEICDMTLDGNASGQTKLTCPFNTSSIKNQVHGYVMLDDATPGSLHAGHEYLGYVCYADGAGKETEASVSNAGLSPIAGTSFHWKFGTPPINAVNTILYLRDNGLRAPAWLPFHSFYAPGDHVSQPVGSDFRTYICTAITTGISGASGPSGTGSGIVDGGVTWDFVTRGYIVPGTGDPLSTDVGDIFAYERIVHSGVPAANATLLVTSHTAGTALPTGGGFRGTPEATSSYGIYWDNVANCRAHDLEIKEVVLDCHGMQSPSSTASCNHIRVWDSWFHHCGRGGLTITGIATDVMYINVRVEDAAQGTDFEVAFPNLPIGLITMIGCTFTGSVKPGGNGLAYGTGAPNSDIQGFICIGCTFDNNLVHVLSGSDGSDTYQSQFIGCSFTNSLNEAFVIRGNRNASCVVLRDCLFKDNGRPANFRDMSVYIQGADGSNGELVGGNSASIVVDSCTFFVNQYTFSGTSKFFPNQMTGKFTNNHFISLAGVPYVLEFSDSWKNYHFSGNDGDFQIVDTNYSVTQYSQVRAFGSYIAASGGAYLDNDNVAISDGVHSKTFEFQKTGSFVPTPGYFTVDIRGLTTDVEIKNALLAVIQGQHGSNYTVTATDPDPMLGSFYLTNDNFGTAGNVAITKMGAGGTIHGMLGGLNPPIVAGDYTHVNVTTNKYGDIIALSSG